MRRRWHQTTWDWMEPFAIRNHKCHVSGPCSLNLQANSWAVDSVSTVRVPVP